MDLVLSELREGEEPFLVYGELVHNPQVMEALSDRGVGLCEDPALLGRGTLFIRTHGVTMAERERLRELPVNLRDLTCPRVGRALSIAASKARQGYDVVILGDSGHQEVRAIRSYAGEGARVIAGPEEVEGLPELRRPFLLSQTTQSTDRFRRTLSAMEERFPGLEHAFTVCDSTERRQAELRELCPKVDAVVVVGGRNSANTNRLVEIAGEEGLPAFHVELPEELSAGEMAGYDRVLLTAGASTPSWIIRRVRERLLELQGGPIHAGLLRRLARSVIYGNFHLPAVTLAAGLAGGSILGGSGWLGRSLSASLFLYGAHTTTSVLESSYSRPSGLRRRDYLRRNRGTLAALSVLGFAGSLAVGAVMAGLLWTLVLCAMLAVFLLYSLPLLRHAYPWSGLRAIPGSRDVMFAGAWSFLLALLPGISAADLSVRPGPVLWAGTLFFLFLARSLLADLVDMQGDALMGMDTIPIHAGRRRSLQLFWSCSAIACLLSAAGILLRYMPPCAAFFALGVVMLVLSSAHLSRRPFPTELHKRVLTDGSLLLAGLAPIAACWGVQ